MIAIRAEIAAVEAGQMNEEASPLRNAPHTLADITEPWNRAYSIEEAVFPMIQQRQNKFWPSINRIDNVFGDRNFVCSCPPIESYE